MFLNSIFLNSPCFKPFFLGGFDGKSFLVFLVLVSGKLDTNLSDSF
ncbi:hypothetical protein HMPREF1436_01265 [Helicobacter pylori GAMchJs136i]|nr:hypothetical protein HMPREF1436_01265 [Helicobacter pylori GAMchJs136i]